MVNKESPNEQEIHNPIGVHLYLYRVLMCRESY